MSWLATWCIFELIGLGGEAAPDLSKIQAFKIFFLAKDGLSNSHFSSNIYKKLYPIQVFDVRYDWPKWKRCPFTAFTASASSFRSTFLLQLPPFPETSL